MKDDNASRSQMTINLTKGFKALIDSQDSDLAALNWCVSTSPKRKTVYAYRAVTGDNKRKEYLGRVILARKLKAEGKLEGDVLPVGMTCSYLDKNSLNCSRENLEPKIWNVSHKKGVLSTKTEQNVV